MAELLSPAWVDCGMKYRGLDKRQNAGRSPLHLAIQSLSSDSRLDEKWRDLASRALVPNVFYEPEFAIPAAIPFGDGVQLLTVSEGSEPDASLAGLWPFRLSRTRWGVPIPVMVGWNHPFASLGVPLLDRDRAEEALCLILSAPEHLPGLPRRLLLPLIPNRGPFADILTRLENRSLTREAQFEIHSRAMLAPDNREGYFERHLSSSTRSKLRQEFRRLERQGSVRFEAVTNPNAVDAALEDYIALEAGGWKGRAGTAVNCSPAETAFLKQAVARLAIQGRARIDRLVLNEQSIASSVTFMTGRKAWYAKISFDESQSNNSPGSQLVVHVTNSMLADARIEIADSCAPPGHPLMRRFWAEEEIFSNRLIESIGGDRLHRIAVEFEKARLRASAALQRAKKWRRARRERTRSRVVKGPFHSDGLTS